MRRTLSMEAIEVPHDGALSKQITRTSVAMLLLGCSVTVVAWVAATVVETPEATEAVKQEMLEQETGNLRQLAVNKATFATEVLARVKTDMVLIHSFAEAAFQGSAPSQPHKSFPAIPAQGFTAADGTYSTEHAGKSWEHSNYYLPGRVLATEDQAAHTQTLLDRTAGIDLAFRSLSQIYGLTGTLLYIGLEDPGPGEATDPAPQAIYKTYPGEDMTTYSTWGARHAADGNPKWCDARWIPAAGDPAASWPRQPAPAGQPAGFQRQAQWYDPRCRGWYQDARESQGVIFTAPYTDANSGLLVMTAAAPIYRDPTTKLDVSAADPFASSFQPQTSGCTSLSESSPSTFRLRTWTRRSSARRSSAMATLI